SLTSSWHVGCSHSFVSAKQVIQKLIRRVIYAELGINVSGHCTHRGNSRTLWARRYCDADRLDLVRRFSHSLRSEHGHRAACPAGLKRILFLNCPVRLLTERVR